MSNQIIYTGAQKGININGPETAYEQYIRDVKEGRFDPSYNDIFKVSLIGDAYPGISIKNITMPIPSMAYDDFVRDASQKLNELLLDARSEWLNKDTMKKINRIDAISRTLGILVGLATFGALISALFLIFPPAGIGFVLLLLFLLPTAYGAGNVSLLACAGIQALVSNLLLPSLENDQGFKQYRQHYRLVCEAEADIRRAAFIVTGVTKFKNDTSYSYGSTQSKCASEGYSLAKCLTLGTYFDKEGNLQAQENSLAERMLSQVSQDEFTNLLKDDSNWGELLKSDNFGLSEYEQARLVSKLLAFSACTSVFLTQNDDDTQDAKRVLNIYSLFKTHGMQAFAAYEAIKDSGLNVETVFNAYEARHNHETEDALEKSVAYAESMLKEKLGEAYETTKKYCEENNKSLAKCVALRITYVDDQLKARDGGLPDSLDELISIDDSESWRKISQKGEIFSIYKPLYPYTDSKLTETKLPKGAGLATYQDCISFCEKHELTLAELSTALEYIANLEKRMPQEQGGFAYMQRYCKDNDLDFARCLALGLYHNGVDLYAIESSTASNLGLLSESVDELRSKSSEAGFQGLKEKERTEAEIRYKVLSAYTNYANYANAFNNFIQPVKAAAQKSATPPLLSTMGQAAKAKQASTFYNPAFLGEEVGQARSNPDTDDSTNTQKP